MSNVTNLFPPKPNRHYSIKASEGSQTSLQIQEMADFYGYSDDMDGLFDAMIELLHHLALAEINGGYIVITPPDGAPIPVPFKEWMRPKPKSVD